MKFLRRVKKGAEALTPLQLARAKRWGTLGQLVGCFLGTFWLIFLGYYAWILFLVFTMIVVGAELVSVHQQVRRMESFAGRK